MHLHICIVLMLPHHRLVVHSSHAGEVAARDHVLLVGLHVLAALPEFVAGVGVVALLVAGELLAI